MGDVWDLLVDPVLVGVSWGSPDPAKLAEVRLEVMVSLPRRVKGAWPSASGVEERRFLGPWTWSRSRLELLGVFVRS